MWQKHISKDIMDILSRNGDNESVIEILSETADEIIDAFDTITEEFYFQNVNHEHWCIPRYVQWM